MTWCAFDGAGVTISTPSSNSYRFPSSGNRSRSASVYRGTLMAIAIHYLRGDAAVYSAWADAGLLFAENGIKSSRAWLDQSALRVPPHQYARDGLRGEKKGAKHPENLRRRAVDITGVQRSL